MTLNRSEFLTRAGVAAGALALGRIPEAQARARTEVAAYYFPQFHPDPRNDGWHGAGWTEWEIVKRAEPRFKGHRLPNVPAWGYEDESEPRVMERKIDAAADHGLNAFIFDWYWYENSTFLAGALERGYLRARNNRRLKFALMWANHDWWDLYPHKRAMPLYTLLPGAPATSPESFRAATDLVIERYLGHPSYWRIDDRPYFSLYDLGALEAGMGGRAQTRAALDDFRERARAAGRGDLHLNAVITQWIPEPDRLLTELGFDSATHYTWIHHEYDALTEIAVPYAKLRELAPRTWERLDAELTVPYIPTVSMGWDPSPRTAQSDVYEHLGYPFTPVLVNNTPHEFRRALESVEAFVSRRTTTRVATINAWNEWPEGSYLEPDRRNGKDYLQATRRVFG
jgi:Glycosyltransferase WbsX